MNVNIRVKFILQRANVSLGCVVLSELRYVELELATFLLVTFSYHCVGTSRIVIRYGFQC